MIVSTLRNIRQSRRTDKAPSSTSLIESAKEGSTSEKISNFLRANHCSLTLTSGNVAYCAVVLSAAFPSLSQIFFMLYRFVFGLLYPTYRSYKALKYKNHKECVSFSFFSFFLFFPHFSNMFCFFRLE